MTARELRVAISPGATGFDAEARGANGFLQRLCYARLLTYPPKPRPDGDPLGDVPNLEGALAESWEASEDGTVYTVRLRRGIRSAFGNEFTADDVVWGWERAFGLRDVGKWVAIIGSVTDPANVVARDSHTVEFHLRAPNPTLLQQLTRMTPVIHDSTAAREHATDADPWATEWLTRTPAGFGAYHLESLSPWDEAVFARNPGAPAAPAIERIRVRFVAGARERRRLLEAGEIDILPEIRPGEVAALRAAEGVRVAHAPSGAHVLLAMNCRQEPFTSREVRQAVCYAVPYDQILRDVYLDTADPWRSPLPMGTPMASDEGWPYRHDPDRARSLLRQAGLPGGFETDLFVDVGAPDHVASAHLIVAALAEVGIRVELELLDPTTHWAGARYFRPYPMLIYSDHHQVPDPYYGLVHDYSPSRLGLINVGNYANDRVVELTAEVERTPDPAAREQLVREAQRLITEDAPNAYLSQPAFLAAMTEDLEGFYWPPDRGLIAERLSFRGS